MKSVIIVLSLLILCNSISAQTIEIDYPEKVGINEEFEIKLTLINFSESNYDVKIDALKDGERISKILVDSEWKSTYYFVKNSISDSETFFLKIFEECFGQVNLSIRIRKNGESSYELFEGYEIEIDEDFEIEEEEDEEDEENEDEDEDEERDTKNEDEDNEEKEGENYEGEDEENNSKEVKINKTKEAIPIKIYFNQSKDIKSENSTNFYKNLLAFSGIFSISLFLALAFLIQKQTKYKNEFR